MLATGAVGSETLLLALAGQAAGTIGAHDLDAREAGEVVVERVQR
jgi:hypothetical protein